MSSSAQAQKLPLGNPNAMNGDPGEILGQLQGSSGVSSTQSQPSPQQMQAMQQMGGASSDQKPREVGSIPQEIITRPLVDIAKGIKDIFSVDKLFGVESPQESPEDKAKKKQVHSRFNSLSQEEQAVSKQRYQKEMERKQRMAEEDEMSRRKAAQAKQTIEMPSGPQKGNKGKGGNSGKQMAMKKLEDDRTKLSSVQGAN